MSDRRLGSLSWSWRRDCRPCSTSRSKWSSIIL